MICEAYGPELPDQCFVALVAGHCADAQQCAETMAAERVRLFDRIHALAAAGEEPWRTLADEFTAPEQLLGGPAAD